MPSRTDFPTLCTLVDTGERRHPAEGELYFYASPNGDFDGPFRANTMEKDEHWAYGPEHYAIYKVMGEEGEDGN